MSTINYLTQEEYDKLLEELDYLKTVERDKASKAIAEAREKGDLSENAEYDAAKEAQGKLELRINQLSKALNNSRVISADDLDGSSVTILCKVTIKNKKNNAEMTYQLVSESTADLKQKKISVTSPIGKAL
ncbi:MAG: transcription elongation factor GreA, partial [Bacteroidota bacterium]